VPVEVLFIGIVTDPEETHAVWYGMLNTLGIFDLSVLTDAERLNYAEKRHYFWFGEVGMAAMMAGVFAGRAEITHAFIGAAVLFLPLFVFMPKLIQCGMKADSNAAIDAFGKNEQVKKSVLDHVRRDGRTGDGLGCGSVDSSTGGRDYYRDGGLRRSPPSFIPRRRYLGYGGIYPEGK
jgi:hypothetical protein